MAGFINLANAQEFPWGAYFGNQGADFATDIHQTIDDGYIIAAYGSIGNAANYYIVKLDAYGLLQWEVNLSKDNYDARAYSILPLSDGGYVVVGRAGMQRKPWLVKLDNQGEPVWTSEWTDDLPANSALAAKGTLLPDNRIVVVGASGDLGQQPTIFIVNPEGELLEQRQLNAPVPPGWYAGTFVSHIEPTSDGGFVMTGTAGSGSGSKAFLWKFDQQADSSWVKLYQNEGMRGAESVKQHADGGYIMAGYSSPNSEDACAMRTDENGTVLWFEVYPDEMDNPATDVIPWHNDEFIITEKRFYGAGATFFQAAMLRIDEQGNLLGRYMIMASDSSTAITRMRNTSDGGFIMAGEINEYLVMNEQDLFVLKSDSNGIITGVAIDYVWPGDVNLDGIVDMDDLMILGLTAGATGPARVNASLEWFPQYVTNWADTVVIGVNYKHADTDGNGIVDIHDTLAIIQNYGLTHNYSGRSASEPQLEQQSHRGMLDLFVNNDEILLFDGKHIEVPVHLGSADKPIDNLYGFRFSVQADAGIIQPENVKLDYSTSWLGEPESNLWAMRKNFDESGITDFGVTLNDHAPKSGYGQVALLKFTLVNELLPGESIDVELGFGNFMAYGYNLDPIELFTGFFTLTVTNNLVQLGEYSRRDAAKIYPNPSDGIIYISGHQAGDMIRIYDSSGRLVMQTMAASPQLQLLLERAGVYIIEIQTANGIEQTKLIVY
jgi:hypothetical protein